MMTNPTTPKECAATATTETAEAKNHGNAVTKNYTQPVFARTVT